MMESQRATNAYSTSIPRIFSSRCICKRGLAGSVVILRLGEPHFGAQEISRGSHHIKDGTEACLVPFAFGSQGFARVGDPFRRHLDLLFGSPPTDVRFRAL